MTDDNQLFGHDMRHRPLPRVMPTAEHGYFGRLSGYGDVPSGYVTVDISMLDSIPKDAKWLDRRKLAIPIRDFARARQLTIHEQWTLLQHFSLHLFYDEGKYHKHYSPSLANALMEAYNANKMSEFTALFWDIRRDDPATVKAMEKDIRKAEKKLMTITDDVGRCQGQRNRMLAKVEGGDRLTAIERRDLSWAENCISENEPVMFALRAKIASMRGYIEDRTLEY